MLCSLQSSQQDPTEYIKKYLLLPNEIETSKSLRDTMPAKSDGVLVLIYAANELQKEEHEKFWKSHFYQRPII